MTHRRRVAALVLLLAMTISLTETVWASACAPVMETMAGAAAEGAAAMEGMPADHDCPPGREHDSQNSGKHQVPCPFAPVGAPAGCTASAVLPATAATLMPALAESATDHSRAEPAPHLLRSASIFHPPKA